MPVSEAQQAKLDEARKARAAANGESPGLIVPVVAERRTRNDRPPMFGARIGLPAMTQDEPAVVMQEFTGGEDTFYDVTAQVSVTGDVEACWIIRNIISLHTRNRITATPREGSGDARMRFNVTFHTES
jgi:hypothetical protein